MSANAKQVVGDTASPSTTEIDRAALAKVKEVRDGEYPEYPFEVHSLITGNRLARFSTFENADGFIHNIALEILQRG